MRRRLLLAIATVTAFVVLASGPAAAAPSPSPSPVADDPSDPVRAAEYWLDGAGIREAWQVTRGEGVTIAVIDTGIGKPPVIFDGAVLGGTDVQGMVPPTAALRLVL